LQAPEGACKTGRPTPPRAICGCFGCNQTNMSGDSPSDLIPTRREQGSRRDVHRSLQSRRWRYTLRCLAGVFGFTALALAVVDHGVLAWIESSSSSDARSRVQLATRSWQQENERISENNFAKVLLAPDEWIWRSRGFPATEERLKPHRILVVGDSFVWGDGYANMNDIWWRQLERELRRRGYADVEVMALGACGASTREELERLRKVLPRYHPDLVIWSYVTNDADEGRVKQFDYDRLNRDDVVRHHHRHAEQGWLRRLHFQLEQRRREKLLATLPGEKRGYEYNDWELRLIEPANLAVYEKTLREVAAFMREAGTPYFFITLPNYPNEASFRSRYAPIKPLFAAAGIPLVDILDDFAAAHPPGKQLLNDLGWGINPVNGHPGVVLTRFYAREAADLLERSYASALGPRGEPEANPAPTINDWMPAKLAVAENTTGRIRFVYPIDDGTMLRMPLERSHVQLHLSMPSDLREIRLAGPSLKTGQIHLTRTNPEDGIDYGVVTAEPQKSGTHLQWELPAATGQLVNTVRVVAEFTGDDRSLTLDLVAKAP
jgi:lysophospholipase L1-like esterase